MTKTTLTQDWREITGTGWKMLGPYANTDYNGVETIYPAPQDGAKWSDWFNHPEPATEHDGYDCGPGGWHVMITRGPDARYAPQRWWPYFVQWKGLIGQSDEKVRVLSVRTRIVPRKVFFRIIRLGWCSEADLRGADLRDADLSRADLRGADLSWADLSGADLREANLSWANLSRADLSWADLSGADLREANLSWADLRGADLGGAGLYGANLSWANLREANLREANLSSANLREANLRGADLEQIIKDEYTTGL